MKKLTRNALATVLMLAMVSTLLAGCTPKTAGKDDTGFEPRFVSANNIHGTSLDPGVDYCGSRNEMIGVCETLELRNYLTQDCEQADEYTWVLLLRNDVSFSNGKKLTAEAVKLNRISPFRNRPACLAPEY